MVIRQAQDYITNLKNWFTMERLNRGCLLGRVLYFLLTKIITLEISAKVILKDKEKHITILSKNF